MSKELPKRFKKNINHALEIDKLIEAYATENDLTLSVVVSMAKKKKNIYSVTGGWFNYGNSELKKPLMRGILEVVNAKLGD